ncbi:class I SAM-dependent methyltransferase [Aquabacterium sp.]|uniref:class I SAM-dependent methyltransferase n=1 Tax=Aquabacterium sp. TaxID=1872578 RepID=UPI0025BF2E80|nr:class I SAM-dependent methyltransferase [Aquabacterium sp.]
MSIVKPIIELHPWLALPPGQALLAWEQAQMDRLVADVFGFHALQLGLPELDGLRHNRMPHRWLALDAAYQGWVAPPEVMPSPFPTQGPTAEPFQGAPLSLRCDFEALPFPSNSLDLVVLPHALELARDPHDTLREVERVLMPEGRVVIAGFNPASLWGLWQRMGHWGVQSATVLPQGEFIAYWRLRDWLRLLDLEVEAGCFGCYRPMVQGETWWQRLSWMEAAGDRWWPVLGAVYFVVAVKRARGVRLIGKVKKARMPASAAPAVVAQRHQRCGAVKNAQKDVNG